MVQENMDDFMAMAKTYAKTERELGVQKWVYISFEHKDLDGTCRRIFSYDLPREVYERRKWVIRWREAKLICQYPKDQIRTFFCYYDKRLGNNTKLNDDLRRLISAKAMVTKVQRRIDTYVLYNKTNNIFFNESMDTELQAIRQKLAVRIEHVKQAEKRMMQKIEEIKRQKYHHPFQK